MILEYPIYFSLSIVISPSFSLLILCIFTNYPFFFEYAKVIDYIIRITFILVNIGEVL